jgi:hypothetical protein
VRGKREVARGGGRKDILCEKRVRPFHFRQIPFPANGAISHFWEAPKLSEVDGVLVAVGIEFGRW